MTFTIRRWLGAAALIMAGTVAAHAQTTLKWAHVYEASEPFHTESVWAAEEIVGAAWMAGLDEAEKQATARRASGCGDTEGDSRLRKFIDRERVVWEQAERIRTLEILADRDRLAAAEQVRRDADT